MAKQEFAREDLLRDGKNFRCRGEIALQGCKVIVGFRDQDQFSLYCGEDPVFQFNADAELRRVFFDGAVYRASSGDLMRMIRASRGGRVVFDSSTVSGDLLQQIQSTFEQWSKMLRESLGSENWRVVGESRGEFLGRLDRFLMRVCYPVLIAQAPNLQ